MIPIEEYKLRLKSHDWTYAMSDDHSVYLRGCAAENALLADARKGGDEYKRAYNEAYAAEFHRDPWCKPYTFPFTQST